VPRSVIVLEDDPHIRRAVVRQIAEVDGFAVVAEAGDVAGGRAALAAGADLGVFDLELADGSSIPLIREATDKGVAVLVLTVWDDDDKVYQAIAAGAAGYLLKGDAGAKVAESLAVLADGGSPISPSIARRLLDDLRTRAPAAPTPATSELTPREREIIELFAKGATYDDVARMLAMSVNTVRHHVRGMYKKLHVSSKAEAVTTAYRLA